MSWVTRRPARSARSPPTRRPWRRRCTSPRTPSEGAPPARRGIGTLLYQALFDALADEGLHRAYAGIAQPNAASTALHERFGFRYVGTYREVGHKFGRWWDVAWHEKEL